MMDTNELIRSLAADASRPVAPLSTLWWGAAGLAIALAALVFFGGLDVRPDFAAAAETPRFLFKFAFTLTLAASAFGAARAVSRPGDAWRKAMPYLAAAPVLVILGVVAELVLLPPDAWSVSLIGVNPLACLASIALIGSGPLAIFIVALRHSAPTRPALAGAVAGLLAGGIGATFFAAKCTNDSPLFVATWYTLAILGLALLGAVLSNRFARW